MSWFIADDPDEWETVFTSGTYGKYPGTNIDFGWAGVERRRRAPEDIARRKAQRRAAHEAAVLAEADAIRSRHTLGA